MVTRSWSAEFSDVLRFAASFLGVLLVAYVGYVVVIVALGTIQATTTSNLEIDSGQLDGGPGTPTALLVTTVQSEPELVGWSAGNDFTAQINLLDESASSACFEVLARTVYVAEATRSGQSWSLSGIVRDSGPDQWTPVRGAVSGDCISRIGEG